MRKKLPSSQEDSFIKEVTEELKADNMRLLWKKYGFYITLAIVLILTVTVSFETIKAWRVKSYQNWSDQYAYALMLQNEGRYEESLKILDAIQKSGHDIYADIAKIQISNIYFEQSNTEKALEKLQEIVNKKGINEEIRNVAAIKLATYKLDYAPAQEIKDILMPLANSESVWTNIAKELLALLEIREGNMEEAADIYNEILNSGKIDDNLKSRVKDMLSILNSETQVQSKNNI